MKTVFAILVLAFTSVVSAKTCMSLEAASFRDFNNEQYLSVKYKEVTSTNFEISYVKMTHFDRVFGMMMTEALTGVKQDIPGLLIETNGITVVYEKQGNDKICEVEPSVLDDIVDSTTQWFKQKKAVVNAYSRGIALETANFLYDHYSSEE